MHEFWWAPMLGAVLFECAVPLNLHDRNAKDSFLIFVWKANSWSYILTKLLGYGTATGFMYLGWGITAAVTGGITALVSGAGYWRARFKRL